MTSKYALRFVALGYLALLLGVLLIFAFLSKKALRHEE